MNALNGPRIFQCLAMSLALIASAAGAEPPRAGPRPPRDELAAFSLADPALTIELVAAEPEVTSPVAIAWDEDGRLYVAEMIDYPVASVAGRIRRLEDRDGDGRYEHATVFADGLPFPNGVLPCFGGVLVTAAPNIWFFRDRDGDGRAEEKTIVLTGFGEGNTQLRVNGLSFGLDNMIYAANGRSGGLVRSPNVAPARPFPSISATCGFTWRRGREHPRRPWSRPSPASASLVWRTTTGGTVSPHGTRSRCGTSCSNRRH